MSLFNTGDFTLASGQRSRFKIDCDVLTDDDLRALAQHIVGKVSPFRAVVPVPTGGNRLAAALRPYARVGESFRLLIVDDVLTTGRSIEKVRKEFPDSFGVVIFSRSKSKTPAWVWPLFTMTEAGY